LPKRSRSLPGHNPSAFLPFATIVRREGWKQAHILTEIVCCEFPRIEAEPMPADLFEQFSLFETAA
jgi:hypothetical protein